MKAAEVPPHIADRYGLGRTPWWTIGIVALVVATFVAALGWATYNIAAPGVDYKLLTWQVVADDHTRVVFEVRKGETETVTCVVRAQDSKRIDVAYATVAVPVGTPYSQIDYQLRTIAPAFTVEVLGCGVGGPPTRIPGPQFPPGVLPPEQPWTPSSS